ncbi:TAT-variant-translocated molybdopterin oxidoreductase [Pontibacter sp. KCTC 32443]|uniref:TAT-variant-translocated molybdopterin oxidoreductase n=1 Tax=Pontibacter TaxID=323449 RepID=UPI00164D0010|nr:MULTISPECIES: TAT-variant-translocated molybdopterin oxidoreductase [Pontibacter]MBC5773778.1 TAT-variant-translocated molybdopterin oxidoreductase [Pontibacter sp. KCTC 32443]
MQDRIKYWKGIEELENTPEFAKHAHNEFPEFLPVNETSGEETSGSGKTHRRDFLKLLGFSVAAVSLASCEAPVRKAIPYLNKPVDVEPGTANWYATTYYLNGDYNSILVKTREARPIKIEPNPTSALTPIGTSSRAQASVLSVYDNNRLRTPLLKGKEAKWEEVDREIASRLRSVNGKVAIVSSTVISPSTKQLINEFGSRFGNFEHVVYDANSSSALLSANNGVVPGYDFSKANIIVSINADFLGTWLAPIIFAKQYITNRKVSADKKDMSRHYQFETIMSLTGANADIRVPIKPSDEYAVVSALHKAITGGAAGNVEGIDAKALANAVKDLKANAGKALVVSGSNDPAVQAMVTAINQSLGAEGSTIDSATPYFVKQGNDAQMIRLINDMNNGTVGAVFFYNANPAYDHPLADKVVSGLKKVSLKVSFAERVDETAALADIVAPDHNYLESWNDFEPKKGYISLAQPVLSPIFTTRQMQDSLLTWSGNNTSYYEYIRNNWRKVITGDFNKGWEKAVHDGVLQNGSSMLTVSNTFTPATITARTAKPAAGAIEAVLYEKVAIGNGTEANNPWLQEMADPITKATWGNYVTMSRKMSEDMKLVQGDVVRVTMANGKSIELPVLVQPGQAQGTVGIAMGYGRDITSMPVAKGLGANAFPIATVVNNSIAYTSPVKIEKTEATSEIAQMQTHHTIMDRLVVQENTLAQYVKNPKEVTEYVRIATHEGPAKPSSISLWDDYEYKNHHWGMVIDLNSCIGCGACTISCQAENNIPVVGKAEVLNRREMHWMRIDRYYSAVEHEEKDYATMEDPAENPSVIFQPMLCQHCNHAPCETVCPVAATMHSSEGINQMAYNRCVGTRYCANNCPYKVRRFNWFAYSNNDKFDYTMNNDLAKFVLNPDVTVRGRGVMEKCSFCVQRVQLGKLEAKRENRRPKDGEIVTACAQSCPTEAIVFGDMLDKESRISKILAREKGERAFHVLEELNVQPNVTYLTKIRNLA